MAQDRVAHEQEEHIAQVHVAKHKFVSIQSALATWYHRECTEESDVCRVAALEVIAHEAHPCRAVVSEACSAGQAELSRALRDSNVATALELHSSLRLAYFEELHEHVAGLHMSHQRSLAEMVQEKTTITREAEAMSVALRHSCNVEQALTRKLSEHSFVMGVMGSRLMQETAMMRNKAHTAQEDITAVKTESRQRLQEQSRSFGE